jgi:NAD-dependent deacetylase
MNTLAEWLKTSRCVMALTGAGISAESGIHTFRGVQGLWEKYDIMEFAHIDSFRADPVKVWRMLLELDQTILKARPNAAHAALAELEAMGILGLVVTQNVDNLHQDAGSHHVVEFHGNAKRFRCLDCGTPYERAQVNFSEPPPRCFCTGLIKPDVVFFGEAIPWAAHARAFDMARQADLVLVVGTSAVVAPASDLPLLAKHNGARVVEINPEATVLTEDVTDLILQGPASQMLPPVLDLIRRRA